MSKSKVASLLHVVRSKSLENAVFKISDITAMIGISSNAGTIMRQSEIVKAVKTHRGQGAEYRWLRGEVTEELIDELMTGLQDYARQFANKKNRTPEIKHTQAIEPENTAKIINVESLADSTPDNLAFQIIHILLDMKMKVDYLYNTLRS